MRSRLAPVTATRSSVRSAIAATASSRSPSPARSAQGSILEGSLYPVLHRLERDGLVTSSWANAAGRKRRVYKLSRKGRATLAQQERDWRRFERAMNLILVGR